MLNTNEHVLTNPVVRVASQGGSVDWFGFWLQDYEDTDRLKAEQYARWCKLKKMQDENDAKDEGRQEKSSGQLKLWHRCETQFVECLLGITTLPPENGSSLRRSVAGHLLLLSCHFYLRPPEIWSQTQTESRVGTFPCPGSTLLCRLQSDW
jgi:hypothetical protein